MEEMLKLVGFYFPIVVTAFLLMRIEKKLNEFYVSISEPVQVAAVLKLKGRAKGKLMGRKGVNWQKIVIHHSASPTEVRRSGKNVPVDADIIREWHLSEGWGDIGYHFVIMPDGSCENGRHLYQVEANRNEDHRKSRGIGVCLVGNFSETEVPEAQLRGLINKVAQLLRAFKLEVEDVELHRDVARVATECPGRYFPADVLMQELEKSLCE
ncbi:N-acetylmuramoyl-L-alanine amidase [Desulfosporosinus sp. OT]|uniref:N-acetylmuramoyl-L-alanine amidase n=1 Tax=Desulfosporosinus sp. OT TaxID=913865 RepID=UPI000223A6E6|nr:N-acetylmuramoyl-L-alanine amidase [Desulfosporosinus sp. OT]EGW41233.1 N-acetylmuramoyl-L-alanine amidase family protein [Desulfosporosinus sp. OT]